MRVHGAFVPIALSLAVLLSVILVVGAGGFDITGHVGTREIAIACAILAISVVLHRAPRRPRPRAAPVRELAVDPPQE